MTPSSRTLRRMTPIAALQVLIDGKEEVTMTALRRKMQPVPGRVTPHWITRNLHKLGWTSVRLSGDGGPHRAFVRSCSRCSGTRMVRPLFQEQYRPCPDCGPSAPAPAAAEPPLRGPVRMMGVDDAPLENDLRRQGLRLEAAASTLNGLCGRADAARFDEAVEQHGLERDAFRALLHARAGIPAEQIEKWLAL